MLDCFLDALVDTAKLIGILYLVYLLVSYLEHHNNEKFHKFMSKTQKAGPFMGAVLGIVPQCGFSAVMSDLFSKHKITMGTLIAVFIATSDEAIPILVSYPNFYKPMFILLAIKLVYAIIIGYIIDLVILAISARKKKAVLQNDTVPHNHEHAHCDDHHCCADNIFLDALKHTLTIAAFLFVATFVINIIVYYVGIEKLSSVLLNGTLLQPLIAGAVGLIPNCCASVVLIELFLQGGLSFGSLVAGLCAGSGVGLIVLFRRNKPIWQNLLITAICYVSGVALGIVICLF